jgi:hypothetical protein
MSTPSDVEVVSEPATTSSAPTSSEEEPVVLDAFETTETKEEKEAKLVAEENQRIEEAERELAEITTKEEQEKQEQEERQRQQKQKEAEEASAKLREEEAAAKLQAEEAAAELLQKNKQIIRQKLVGATKEQKEKNAKLQAQLDLAQQEAERKAAKKASLEANLQHLKDVAKEQSRVDQEKLEEERLALQARNLEDQKAAEALEIQERTDTKTTTVGDVDWEVLYPELAKSAKHLVETQRRPSVKTDDSFIRNEIKGFMRATLQIRDIGPAPVAPAKIQFTPKPGDSQMVSAKKENLHKLKSDSEERKHTNALQEHSDRVALEQRLFETKQEAAVKSVLATRPFVDEWLLGLENEYIAPMLQVLRDTHVLNEVLVQNKIRFSNLREAYLSNLAPLKEAFQGQLQDSPFSAAQIETISGLMGMIPEEIIGQNGIFEVLGSQAQEGAQNLGQGETSPLQSDFSTGNTPEKNNQDNEGQSQQTLDFETPEKQEPKSMGSRDPNFKIPKIDRSKQPSAPNSSPPTQKPRDNKLEEKYPSATQGYFTGQGNQEDRSLKRQRDPSTDWESQPASSQRDTGGKGGKGKGRGPRGKGKGSAGRGKGNGHTDHNNARPRSDTWNEKRLDNSPIPPQVALAVLGPEAKDQTPCPQGNRCQEVFTCGFKHVVKDYQATLDRSKAEAQVSEKDAIKKLIASYSMAQTVPAFAHVYANQEPNPLWNFKAPKGFHNRARTEDELFREN